MRQLLLAASALALLVGPAWAAAPAIDAAKIGRHVEVLASDAYEGRAPASAGEEKSVRYISEQFKAAGLQPGGDPLKGGGRAWTQDVPLARFQMSGPVAISVKTPAGVETWTQGEQIAIRPAQTGVAHLSLKEVPVVFAGYGVKAPEKNWDDFKGADLKGKIVLVLVNDPDFETGEGPFGGKAMTYYGRWTYKYEEAARQGAAGFVVIHETAPASYGWATVKNSNTGAVFDIVREDPGKSHAPVEAWIQRDAAEGLVKAAGLDFAALKSAAQRPDFKPVELKGVSFSTDFGVDVKQIVSKNVVGRLPGKGHPDETVIYTAHWDHLGVGRPDAKGDRIYNGAVDNADGVAVLIELGRAFAQAPRTDRSIVFLSVTAEEQGLLGSEYYASHPLYPLATTVADLNMDALKPTGRARDFSAAGDAPLTLQDDLIARGQAMGRSFSPDPRPEAGSFFRSDHFPFAKRGVPAISFGSGEDLETGGKAAGQAWMKAYTAERYHQPADQYDAGWNLDGVVQDAGLLYDLGRSLADSREWPSWKAGAEFKAERDKTAGERK